MSRFTNARAGNRSNSPFGDNTFVSATETGFPSHILQSTPQREPTDTQQMLPLSYDEHPSAYEHTQGSAEMSIETGRGLNRNTQQDYGDLSSNMLFTFGGNNSQSEMVGTPLAHSRHNARTSDGTLRKDASIRRATEFAPTNDALRRGVSSTKRAVSDALPRSSAENEKENAQATATSTTRRSRFAGIRHVSSSYNVPKRFTANEGFDTTQQTTRQAAFGNTTVQTATYTANQSFILPDIPNITELLSGVRVDGSPLSRTTATRSRFVSTSHRPDTQKHLDVHTIGVPEDEKAIFASLQLLNAKVDQLEEDKRNAQKHLEECEEQVSALRSQLDVAARRRVNGLGLAENTTESQPPFTEQTHLQARAESAEARLERSERKASVTEITVSRISKERDHLITQLASAYCQNEELERENQNFRESSEELVAENADLKGQIKDLESKNTNLESQLAIQGCLQNKTDVPSRPKTSTHPLNDRPRPDAVQAQDDIADGLTINTESNRSRKIDSKISTNKACRQRNPSGQLDGMAKQELNSKIERELQRQREAALLKARLSREVNHSSRVRSRSKSQRRVCVAHKEHTTSKLQRNAAGRADQKGTGAVDLDFTATRKPSSYAQQFEEDLTQLTDLDPIDVANLRKQLEEEMRARHLKRDAPAETQSDADFTTASATKQSLSRKSSLKDVSPGTNNGTGCFSLGGGTLDDLVKAAKSVRVQSPHTSDEISHTEHLETDVGDTSILSNTSRRRRRTASMDGLTSAFIIPDITIHARQSLPSKWGSACVQHDAASCTACPHDTTEIDIPVPVPVTEREVSEDITNATIRPSQPPPRALATVIKHLEDEIKHLKMARETQNRIYNQHDPALSKRRRSQIRARIERLTLEIEKRSDQVYSLYDVLEGQRRPADVNAKEADETKGEDIEETLQSLGIDPAELSGRVGRNAHTGLDGLDEMDDESELEFEGFSESGEER